MFSNKDSVSNDGSFRAHNHVLTSGAEHRGRHGGPTPGAKRPDRAAHGGASAERNVSVGNHGELRNTRYSLIFHFGYVCLSLCLSVYMIVYIYI